MFHQVTSSISFQSNFPNTAFVNWSKLLKSTQYSSVNAAKCKGWMDRFWNWYLAFLSTCLHREKPVRSVSGMLTFPQRVHNSAVPSPPFTRSAFTFFTSRCYRSPLESHRAPLCHPYRLAPAQHTHGQTKSSISPGKSSPEGARGGKTEHFITA